MFIVVKHGGDETSLFNPDCSLVQLVTDIRKRCQCLSPEVGVALATDKLAIVHLSPEDSLENASSLFVNRTVYTLLAVHHKDGEPPHYEALLDHADHDFVMKLELLSNPGSDLQKPNQHHKSLYKSHRKNTKSNMQQSAATTPTGTAKSSKKTGTKNKITT